MKEYVVESFPGTYDDSELSNAFNADDECLTQAVNDYARKGFILESIHRDYPSFGKRIVMVTTMVFSKE